MVPERLETSSFTFILLCAHHIHSHTFAWPCCWLYRHAKMACHGYVSSQSCGSEESSKLYMCMLWQTAVQSLQNHTAHLPDLPCCKSLTGVWLQWLSPVQHAGISEVGSSGKSATASVLTEVLHTAHKRQPLGSPGKRVLPRLVT